jgi:hypothetical protein
VKERPTIAELEAILNSPNPPEVVIHADGSLGTTADEVIEIKGILLHRQGDYAVVEAWMPDGTYREVIREHLDGPFSHCVHAEGIRRAATVERKYPVDESKVS